MLFQGTRGSEAEELEKSVVEGLTARHWVVGRDFVVVRSYGEWRLGHVRPAVDELIRQKVDVIVLYTPDDVTIEVARATKTVPVVFSEAYAPLELGLVDSYAKPGRNLTGTTIFSGPDFVAKRLEYLRALAPTVTRLFWLYGAGSLSMQTLGGASFESGNLIERAAATLGMTARVHVVRQPSEVQAALSAAAAWDAQAISAGGSPVFVERRQVIDFAAKARLPTVFSVRDYVDAGGLMSYGVPPDEYAAMSDRWIGQIDKVLRGVPVSTIPVEIPRRFELCINAKTAKSLGIAIPLSVLSRADQIVEK
jgi:putative tryptophan/tyrosine transport system substrate-binding protein